MRSLKSLICGIVVAEPGVELGVGAEPRARACRTGLENRNIRNFTTGLSQQTEAIVIEIELRVEMKKKRNNFIVS